LHPFVFFLFPNEQIKTASILLVPNPQPAAIPLQQSPLYIFFLLFSPPQQASLVICSSPNSAATTFNSSPRQSVVEQPPLNSLFFPVLCPSKQQAPVPFTVLDPFLWSFFLPLEASH
jgi:hypothetical protein